MKCGIGHCGHCQLGPTWSAATGRLRLGRGRAVARGEGALMERASRRWRSGSSVLRRLPAQPPRRGGRAARARRPHRDRALRGGFQRDGRPAVRRVARRGLHHDAGGRGTDQASPRRLGPLVSIGACATSGGIQALRNFADVEDFLAAVYATPGVHLDARDVDAHRRPRQRRSRAARLPDRQAPAPRADHGDAAGRRPTSPTHSVCVECKSRGTPCVMVAQGHRLSRPGHARRLRRALPGLRARVLRVLRAQGDAEHRPRSAPGGSAPRRRRRTVQRALVDLQRRKFP